MDIPIIYEDAELLVINKPAGVVVNRAESIKQETIQDWVEAKFPPDIKNSGQSEAAEDFVGRSGIVHRIDKETSGILLISKTLGSFVNLQRQFREHQVHKIYLALIHGILTPFKGQVSAPVGRLPWNREQFGIVAGGKDAVTRYEVIRHLKINFGRKTVPVTYLRLYPESGRTHQIRVHLKYLGFPILGDYLYAGRKTGREDRLWVKRTMLHASELSFIHPVTLQPLTFKTDLPPDMQRILAGAVNA